MAHHDMQLVQWIADRLLYLEFPDLIGQTCKSVSLNSVDADVKRCLADTVPDLGDFIDLDHEWLKRIFDKYQVLDLTIELPRNLWEINPTNGIELLNGLGFLMDNQEAEQFDYVASLVGDNFDDPTMLGELQADLQEKHTVLRLLLKSPNVDGLFTVVDACITNAASVWLHKYPYY